METPEKMTPILWRMRSNHLLKYLDVDDGLSKKSEDDWAEYILEVEMKEDGKTRFSLRWRFVEDRCDAPNAITKSKAFKKRCDTWTTIDGISTSSSFAANLDYWEVNDEE